jgi:hypothetical protein
VTASSIPRIRFDFAMPRTVPHYEAHCQQTLTKGFDFLVALGYMPPMQPLWLRVDRPSLTLARLPWRVALYSAQGIVRPAPSWPTRCGRTWREAIALLALLLAGTAAATAGWLVLNGIEGLWR